ncbi:dehydrogenase/reductase SDR family member 4 [Vigna unguiculata]|uniref:Dehydrogenase/reductase SDR family member 4 n=1 Tax=Vigna unguiculata TaxID=3917 RepID=A0A4D6KRE2_VIGUN|nr:dehydrogenase/reductase SDR family member 4 [Vigna unguiculata]
MEKIKLGMRFQGKVAIVTASTLGIGFSIAQRLGLEGASVVISSRKQQNVDKAAGKLRAQGIQVLPIVCHVANAQQRKNLIDKTLQKYEKIDVVVSNAAVHPSVDPILQTQESILDKLWEINVKSTILLLKDAAPHLKKGSSVALASEMAPNTRVNCVVPGIVPTHFVALYTSNDTIREELERTALIGRLGTAEEMAAATAFLASDDASYITGENLVVSGGMPSRL